MKTARHRRLLPFGALLLPGLCGFVPLFFVARATVAGIHPALRGGTSVDLLAMVTVAPPLVLLIAAVLLGNLLAPAVGLRSHIAEWSRGEGSWAKGLKNDVVAGALGGGVALALALGLAWLLPVAPPQQWSALRPPNLSTVLLGLFYGGITEEVVTRYGGVTCVVWVLWDIGRRRAATPGAWLVWPAILVMALLFGLAHVTAVAGAEPLGPLTPARTVLVTATGGIVFGWLFWRRSLECAICAHATGNAGAAILSAILGG